jgi:hypothetical protein
MVTLLLAIQVVLGFIDGYVSQASEKRLYRLLVLLFIDIPSMLLIVYSTVEYGLRASLQNDFSRSSRRDIKPIMVMWIMASLVSGLRS